MAASGRRSCMDQPQFWPAKIRLGARGKFISRDSLTWAPNHMSMAQALLPAGDCTAELNFYPWEKKKNLERPYQKTWKKLGKNLKKTCLTEKTRAKKTAKKRQKNCKNPSKKLQKNFKKTSKNCKKNLRKTYEKLTKTYERFPSCFIRLLSRKFS